MLTFEQHWEGKDVFGFDFADRLAAGETLSSGADVTCVDAETGAETGDLTIESVAISGTKVVATISGGLCLTDKTASLGRWQTTYKLRVKVVTSITPRECGDVAFVVYHTIEKTAVYA